MPDQGAIGSEYPGELVQMAFPDYAVADIAYTLRQDGFITGVVTESTVPIPNALVTLHWRPSMQPIGRTWSNVAGEYTFTGLDPTKSYTVICQDPAGGVQYNDLVYALIAPST